MIPEGHQPTPEDRILGPVTPEDMHSQIVYEHYFGIDCTYTHYSRNEQVGSRAGFKRRYSRAALDPFEAAGSNIRGIGADKSGHSVMQVGDI